MNAVRPGRPLGYLLAASLVALVCLLIPDPSYGGPDPSYGGPDPGYGGPGVPGPSYGGPGGPGPSRSTPGGPANAPTGAPGCTGVRDSLRPAGPLPAPGAMPAGSTMAAIVARGRLIAGVDQGKYLAGYRNPATAELVGADIDLVHQIAAALFGDPAKVQFVVLNIADRVNAITSKQVDLVVDQFSITCGRQRDVEFSAPYLRAAQRILVPRASGVREVEDLAGKRVCTSLGSTTVGVLRALPDRLDVLILPGIPDCMLELQQGRVAAVSSDDVILAGLAAQDPTTEVVGRPLDQASYGVGMSPAAPDLVRFVNGVLERARADGTLAASDRRWFTGSLDPVPQPAPARYRD
ncbi:MAG TPA: glutamate ABC transporter substrate-binding protein [Pseudonocardia sp.]